MMLRLSCTLVILLTLVSCTLSDPEPAASNTTQPTVIQQVVQDNKQSIKAVAEDLNYDLQIGYRVRQLIRTVKPKADPQYIEVGRITTSIVKQVLAEKQRQQWQQNSIYRWAITVLGAIFFLCFPYVFCRLRRL